LKLSKEEAISLFTSTLWNTMYKIWLNLLLSHLVIGNICNGDCQNWAVWSADRRKIIPPLLSLLQHSRLLIGLVPQTATPYFECTESVMSMR
jgi:hypothetical protein